MMTLSQLQNFQILAQTLHYTQAAREMHISQPSLSYSISELEKELGVQLFARVNHKVTLTIYGQQFLDYVKRALALLDEGRGVLKQISSKQDRIIRLGYFQSISTSLIPTLMESFYSENGGDNNNKNIKFYFTEGSSWDIFNKIQNDELDMGFCLHKGSWARSIDVLRQPLCLAVHETHRFARLKSVAFSDFAAEPQIMLENDTCLRAQLNRLYGQYKARPNIVFEVQGCNTALQYVGLDFGVAVLPQIPIANTMRVVILPIEDHNQELVRTIYFTVHKTRPLSEAAQKVCGFIEQQFVLTNKI